PACAACSQWPIPAPTPPTTQGPKLTVSILRTADAWWVQTPTGAARVTTKAATTRELLANRAAIEAAAHSTDTVPVDSPHLLSPVTAPCRGGPQRANTPPHAK